MTTATKPPPPHGTPYRYRGYPKGGLVGCHCEPCTRAHTRACALRDIARRAGRPALYPAEPLVAHINTLVEAGMSRDLIARRAEVAHDTIGRLVRGIAKSCLREKALRILAVKPGDFDNVAVRPSLGSRRRVQALYYMGHSPQTIAAASGLATSTISHLANGHTSIIDGKFAQAIADVYRQLHCQPGDSRKANANAVRAGWAGPGYWDDEAFDDPTFVPVITEPVLSPAEVAERRREEVEHLAFCGLTPGQISERVDLSIGTIRQLVLEWRRGYKRDRTPAVAA